MESKIVSPLQGMYLLQDGFIAELFLRMEVDYLFPHLTRKEHTFQPIIGFLTGEKVSCNLWKYAQRNLIPCWWKSKKSLLKYFGTNNNGNGSFTHSQLGINES